MIKTKNKIKDIKPFSIWSLTQDGWGGFFLYFRVHYIIDKIVYFDYDNCPISSKEIKDSIGVFHMSIENFLNKYELLLTAEEVFIKEIIE